MEYCYYLIPDKHIPKHADNRLEALSRHSALGAGYFIAQEDLELRGAGQFLGEKQSGHIEEIGLTLYLSILKDCINQLKGIDDKNKKDFEINLGDKSLIPEQYLPSMTDRLKYYRKISACKNVEDIKKISKDLVDQCGKLPTAVNNLLYDAEIALTATEIGISNIYLNRNNFLQFKFAKPISDENFKKFMEENQDLMEIEKQMIIKEYNEEIQWSNSLKKYSKLEVPSGYIEINFRLRFLLKERNKLPSRRIFYIKIKLFIFSRVGFCGFCYYEFINCFI